MGPSKNDKSASDKKKRARFAENEDEEIQEAVPAPNKSARMQAFRETAERRAAHFARAQSSASTTPTGRFRTSGASLDGERDSNGDDDDAKTSWPGPWSTARSILAKREAAKRARDERIAAEKNKANLVTIGGSSEDTAGLFEVDIYEKALGKIVWKPDPSTHSSQALIAIPSLTDITLLSLAQHFKSFSDLSVVPPDLLDRLADEIGKRRELDIEACQRLAIPRFTSLYLPDCGAVDEDMLIHSIETVCGIETVEGKGKSKDEVIIGSHSDEDPLTRLILRSCGRCFTDRVAGAIYNHIHSLETLILTGCYQLTDSGLLKLLEGARKSLLDLSLNCNNRLGNLGLGTIFQLQRLRSLTLDFISQLNDEHFATVLELKQMDSNDETTAAVLPNLQELSLLGLHEVSDASFVPLITRLGGALTSLAISSFKLGDATIVAIREHCRCLESLTLTNCTEVSTAAWLGLFVSQNALESAAMDVEMDTMESTIAAAAALKMEHESIGPLTKVNLKGCLGVSDDVIIELCQQYGKNITFLCVNGCNRLTARALAAMWIHCHRRLQYLDLSFVRNFSEGVLANLIALCHSLKECHIWGCTQVTQALLAGHKGNNLKIVGAFHQLVNASLVGRT